MISILEIPCLVLSYFNESNIFIELKGFSLKLKTVGRSCKELVASSFEH